MPPASSLVWTNVQLTNAGTYSVFISNSVGTALSANATLTPYVPVCDPPPSGLVSWWAGEGDATDMLGTTMASSTAAPPSPPERLATRVQLQWQQPKRGDPLLDELNPVELFRGGVG